jgi:hypothetical protein
MVYSGAVVSFLAADLYSAAALLDRLSGPPHLGVHVPAVRLASALSWERKVFEGRTFFGVWSFGGICGIVLLAAAAQLAAYGHELPSVGRDPSVDQAFIRHMSTHHEQGILLASIAAERAANPHLRALSKLMAASQGGEARILAQWWTSWFGEPMQICSAQERAAMPGLLDAPSVDRGFVL